MNFDHANADQGVANRMSKTNHQLHSRQLLDLAPPDIREHLEDDDTILIPMGACEMHGDHMPLGTDIYNAMEVARRAAEKAHTSASATNAGPAGRNWYSRNAAKKVRYRTATPPPCSVMA